MSQTPFRDGRAVVDQVVVVVVVVVLTLTRKIKSVVKLNSHGRGYPLNCYCIIELRRSHNYPPRGYKLQRLGCVHRTNRMVTVSPDERACCLKRSRQSDDPRACSEKRAIEPKITIQIPMVAQSSRVI